MFRRDLTCNKYRKRAIIWINEALSMTQRYSWQLNAGRSSTKAPKLTLTIEQLDVVGAPQPILRLDTGPLVPRGNVEMQTDRPRRIADVWKRQ
ncbi:unnamed protein product [Protopolystoma xenopodis]|uniref:Uncharacterized protein n=1 Tax=Protopolystoma xenopodis TaxID=117903 RepID=A0A3S5FG47_9PLAT|nr:unnamed protein product [Protopolystoma xenopodis]